jgi:hypothetical protein
MNGKQFLAAGDVLINPALIAYATVETDTEGYRLRLGFAGPTGAPEIVVDGFEARSILRWLRQHAEFLDAGTPHRLTVGEPRSPLTRAAGHESPRRRVVSGVL